MVLVPLSTMLLACPLAAKDSAPLPFDSHPTDTASDSTEETADTARPTDSRAEPDADGDGDGDGSPDAEDCDDDDPSVHPGAPELCNDLDNDCSGVPDDGASCRDQPVDRLAWTTYRGERSGDALGSCPPARGDLDGDGQPELMLTLRDYEEDDGTRVLDRLIVVESTGLKAGGPQDIVSVAAHHTPDFGPVQCGSLPGDLTGDGIVDHIGADEPWQVLRGGTEAGLMQPGAVLEDVLYQSYGTGSWGGYAMASAELTGDGVAELLFTTVNGTYWPLACVYLLRGPPPVSERGPDHELGPTVSELTLCEERVPDEPDFGYSLSASSDGDGDGLPDLLIGGEGGGVTLVLGDALQDDGDYLHQDLVAGAWTLADPNIVWELAAGGDLSGDGYEDWVVPVDSTQEPPPQSTPAAAIGGTGSPISLLTCS